MKLSTQGQHAIMAMLTLAIHEDTGALRLTDIAEQQGISLSYLEQIFAKLRNAGLVEGIRGPGGGYRLAQPLEAINLAEIAIAAEEEAVAVIPRSAKRNQDAVQAMWSSLSQQFYGFLSDITLASLLEDHQVPRNKVYQMSTTASLIARMFPAASLPKPGRIQMAM